MANLHKDIANRWWCSQELSQWQPDACRTL